MDAQYIEWLAGLYRQHIGYIPKPEKLAERANYVVRRHSSRWPSVDDFVSEIAATLAERLTSDAAKSDTPFLELLDQAADAVRHRIAREAKKSVAYSSTDVLDELPSRERSFHEVAALAKELFSELNLEEHTVLAMHFDGVPIEQAARTLNVSARTVYRLLAGIKSRLTSSA